MITRLPRWALLGSGILACIAGTVNTVGLLGFQHQGITHLTGTTTVLGIAAAHRDLAGLAHFGSVIACFVAGATIGGVLIRDSTLRLGRRYGIALLIESALLLAAVPLLQMGRNDGAYLASAACGLQNGMVSTYSGAVIRTTHVSGLFTDLGVMLGHAIRGVPVDHRRAGLTSLLLAAFFTGSVAGALAFQRFEYATLYAPALLTGLTGIAYFLFRHGQIVAARRRGEDLAGL